MRALYAVGFMCLRRILTVCEVNRSAVRLLVATGIVIYSLTDATASGMRVVPGGTFRPFYTNDGPVAVQSFQLDVYPVSNGDFLAFVTARPEWRRANVPSLFADKNYLSHWEDDLILGEQAPSKSPVTHVSWFAARAFAEWKGKRLPTLVEWEYVGYANPVGTTEGDSSMTKRLLAWYSKPAMLPLPPVGSSFENSYGIWDMHGLVWEWVEDFNSIAVSSRADSADDPMSRNFCGGGAVGVADVNNYAAFMRYAFRSSLSPRYTVSQLGFRCARSGEEG